MTEIEGNTLPSRYGFYSRYIVLYPLPVLFVNRTIHNVNVYDNKLCLFSQDVLLQYNCNW